MTDSRGGYMIGVDVGSNRVRRREEEALVCW